MAWDNGLDFWASALEIIVRTVNAFLGVPDVIRDGNWNCEILDGGVSALLLHQNRAAMPMGKGESDYEKTCLHSAICNADLCDFV